MRAGNEKVLRGLRSSTLSAGPAQRAWILVLAAEGHTETGQRAGMSLPTMRMWRTRYTTGGLGQLGVTPWAAHLLADQGGVSFATVARIWRRWGLKPWKAETLELSTDPELEAKIRDVLWTVAAAPHRRLPKLTRPCASLEDVALDLVDDP